MSEADIVGLILILIFIIIFAMVSLYEITYEREKSGDRSKRQREALALDANFGLEHISNEA